MQNLSHNQKLLVTAGAIVAIVAVLGLGLKLQMKTFRVSPPQQIVIESPAAPVDNGAVLGEESQESYTNPLEGIYVNPFSN